MSSFYQKYLKYKNKYLKLKTQMGSGENDFDCILKEQIRLNEELTQELNVIKHINDIDKLKRIVINEKYKWKYPSHPKKKFKCKHFDIDHPDILMVFDNKQRRSDKIFRNLYDGIESNREPIKYFTFIISSEGVKYGEIQDGLEFGVSHMHLVEKDDEKIIIAGEIKIENNVIEYNFNSGTYVADLAKDINTYKINQIKYKKICETAFKIKRNDDPDFDRIVFSDNIDKTLFPSNTYPKDENLKEICKDDNNKIYEGINSRIDKQKCTKNSVTLIEDKKISESYTELGAKLINSETIIENDNYKELCVRYRM